MLNIEQITQETLAKTAASILEVKKTINLATGLQGYNLQAPMHQLVPLMSPFRGSIGRRIAPGTADNWKDITALTQPKPTLAEESGALLIATTKADRVATYKILGVGDKVTLEAQRASAGFDDALAKATANCLLSAMKIEEQYMLGGNITALGAPTGLAATWATGGRSAINAGAGTTYYVRVVALTLPAANRITIDRPFDYDGTHAEIAGTARYTTLATFSPGSDGIGVQSAEVNTGSQTGTGRIKVTFAPVSGASAYAIFVGTAAGAANCKLECIVTQSSVTLFSLLGTGGAASVLAPSDTSADALAYDGIIPQLVAGGAVVTRVNGKLSGTSGTGEVTEVQDMLANLYDASKLGKYRIVMGGQDMRALTARGFTSNVLNVVSSGGGQNFTAGARLGGIINATTGDECSVETAPWLPGGRMIFIPTEVNYPDANVGQAFEWVGSFDWERWDYASTSSTGPIYPFEVRCMGVLESKFSAGCGMLYDIFKG